MFLNSILLILFLCVITIHGYGIPKLEIAVDRLKEISDVVNSKESTWTAEYNFDSDASVIDLTHTVGVISPENIPLSDNEDEDDPETNCENNGLPENFDARKKWSQCKSIGHIYDQGNCGSCWAVSVASAFTDRLCIKTNGKVKATRSLQQITSCCHKCGNGCKGGWPFEAWKYLIREGGVTGGEYDSHEGCQPYLQKPCSHHIKSNKYANCSKELDRTPKCKLHCYNKDYNGGNTYKTDRVKGKSAYAIAPCAAQKDIFNNGPIIATFAVYEDFYTYKTGVYRHLVGKMVGYHAVRIIGWGVENKVPYWLVTNSWNSEWGDQGVFKIIRGDNEVKFEDNLSAIKL